MIEVPVAPDTPFVDFGEQATHHLLITGAGDFEQVLLVAVGAAGVKFDYTINFDSDTGQISFKWNPAAGAPVN